VSFSSWKKGSNAALAETTPFKAEVHDVKKIIALKAKIQEPLKQAQDQ
jgi:hypothetical protein